VTDLSIVIFDRPAPGAEIEAVRINPDTTRNANGFCPFRNSVQWNMTSPLERESCLQSNIGEESRESEEPECVLSRPEVYRTL
jgi:hypothetical protein